MCVLLLLLALVQGKIVSISTKDRMPPYEVDWVDPSTGQFTKIADLDLGADGRPSGGGFLRNDNTVVYSIQNDTFDAYLTTVDLSTGKIQVGKTYPYTDLGDIQLDKVTNQTFVFGDEIGNFGIFEMLPNQTLQQMTKLPSGVPFEISGAYSSSKHIYFLTTGNSEYELELSNVLAVSTVGPQKGTILYNVSVGSDPIGQAVYDDTFGVLYVWSYNDTGTTLVSVDYTTGKILKTFFTSPTFIAGPVCIDKAATAMYTSLFDRDTNRSAIHTVDLASGKASQVPTSRYAMTMHCL